MYKIKNVLKLIYNMYKYKYKNTNVTHEYIDYM